MAILRKKKKQQKPISDSWLLSFEESLHARAVATALDLQSLYTKAYQMTLDALEDLYFDEKGELSRTDVYRKLKLEAIFKQLATKVDKATTEVLMETVEDTDRAISKELGASVDFNFFTEEEAKAIVDADFMNANYSDRIWKNVALLRARVEQDVTRIVIMGESPKKIKMALMKDFNVGWNEADRLIRTEVSRVFNKASFEKYKKTGTTEFVVLVHKDDRTCDQCQELANKVFFIDREPLVPELPVHPNCRCTLSALNINSFNED